MRISASWGSRIPGKQWSWDAADGRFHANGETPTQALLKLARLILACEGPPRPYSRRYHWFPNPTARQVSSATRAYKALRGCESASLGPVVDWLPPGVNS